MNNPIVKLFFCSFSAELFADSDLTLKKSRLADLALKLRGSADPVPLSLPHY